MDEKKINSTGDSSKNADYEVVYAGKKKKNIGSTLIRILVNVAIIALGVILLLWLVSKAAKYDSIGSMLDSMLIELELMWERIRS